MNKIFKLLERAGTLILAYLFRIVLTLAVIFAPIVNAFAAPNHTVDNVLVFNRAEGAAVLENYSMNQSFDKDMYGTRNVGGTLSLLGGASPHLFGSSSIVLGGSLVNDALYVKTIPIPLGVSGRWCQAEFTYHWSTAGGTTGSDWKAYVQDNLGVKITSDYVLPATSSDSNVYTGNQRITFQCPITQTLANRWVEVVFQKMQTTNNGIMVDELKVTESRNVGTGYVNTGWLSTPNSIGAVTTAPTKASTRTTDLLWYRRNGANMDFRIEYAQPNGTGAAAGSGDYLFNIQPNITGCTIDSTKLLYYTGSSGTGGAGVGSASASNATAVGYGVVVPYDSSRVRISTTTTGATTANWLSNTWFNLSAAVTYNAVFSVPCAGFSPSDVITPDQTDYPRTPYTPTFTGFGTVTNVECYHDRKGQSVNIDCKFTVGTTTATEARVSLPTGLTSQTWTGGVKIAGPVVQNFTGDPRHVLIDSAVTYLNFGFQNATTAGLSKLNGTAIAPSSGQILSFTAKVPIAGWNETYTMPALLTASGGGGGNCTNIVTKTASASITSTEDCVLIDATSGSIVLTLPAVTLKETHFFKRLDSVTANTVTIQRASGSDSIDGAASTTLPYQYNALELRGVTTTLWGKF